MGNTHTETGSTKESVLDEALKTVLHGITTKKLEHINRLLGKVKGKTHSIDEIAVVSGISKPSEVEGIEEHERVLLFSYHPPGNRRELTVDDLSDIHLSLEFPENSDDFEKFQVQGKDGHSNVYEVKGQAGELFDFVIRVKRNNHEFLVFGNYLDGTMEDLDSNYSWRLTNEETGELLQGSAKKLFVDLAIVLCELIQAANPLFSDS